MLHFDTSSTQSHYTIMATKTRGYVAIGYPESLDPNWLEILSDTHVQIVISPLHNKDTNEDGTIKKEHYHILVLFDGPKTIEQAQAIFDSIKATKCQPVNSVRGQSRYLCHLDELNKVVYDTGDVTCLNGADYYSLIELPTNKYQAIRDMVEFINYNKIYSFSDFFEYCSMNNENWFRSLCDNSAFIIKEYLKAKTWTSDAKQSDRYSFRDVGSYQVPSKEKEVKDE